MGADRAPYAGAESLGTAANRSASGCCRRPALHFADGVSMASATARFSEAVDGAALLLRVAGRGAVGNVQFPVGPDMHLEIGRKVNAYFTLDKPLVSQPHPSAGNVSPLQFEQCSFGD